MGKRVAFRTFGCRLNQYDTEAVRTLFERQGDWQTVPFNSLADAYVVNTCSVTAQADASARKAIRRICQERPEAKVVVTGCYAQRAPEEIAKLPGVSLIVGAADRARIVEEVQNAVAGELRLAVSPIDAAKKFFEVSITEMADRTRAFVKVQEGCNESCTFCIVPQTRGRSRSRAPEAVLAQVRELLDRGYPEIVLTGVHLGDYGLDLSEKRRILPELIRDILDVEGLARLRLSSIEPASVSEELIDLMAMDSRFARHFHIPFQSGSNEILERMQRRYTVQEFVELIDHIAARIPDCGIGTDVIAGFPGETDNHFQATFDTLLGLPVTYLHAFTYSVRPGSAAEQFGDQVPADQKKRRVRALKRLSEEKSKSFQRAHLGRSLPVLVERSGDRDALGTGWTDNYIRVRFPGQALPGIANMRLTATVPGGVLGQFAGGEKG